ncbi:MAG: KTSC domain-containing protein [Bacteroidota bacterium]|nr:KTSC domain-containing protein [Bacteroidota bacterium]
MKRITDYRKLFGITKDADLAELKTLYRNLMKESHPDKFQDETQKHEAETKSKTIIEAYHFLVSLSPETHLQQQEAYTQTITSSGIDDFIYKGQMLKVTFLDGSIYEYFGVPQSTYNKLINSPTQIRFARRHIFQSFSFRKASNAMVEA